MDIELRSLASRPELVDYEIELTIADYIRYRLRLSGFADCGEELESYFHQFRAVIDPNPLPAIRQFGDAINSNNPGQQLLHNSVGHFNLLSSTELLQQSYNDGLDSMVPDGAVSWGRLLAMLIYTAELAVHSMQYGHQGRVRDLMSWLYAFVHQPLPYNYINTFGRLWGNVMYMRNAIDTNYNTWPYVYTDALTALRRLERHLRTQATRNQGTSNR